MAPGHRIRISEVVDYRNLVFTEVSEGKYRIRWTDGSVIYENIEAVDFIERVPDSVSESNEQVRRILFGNGTANNDLLLAGDGAQTRSVGTGMILS